MINVELMALIDLHWLMDWLTTGGQKNNRARTINAYGQRVILN